MPRPIGYIWEDEIICPTCWTGVFGSPIFEQDLPGGITCDLCGSTTNKEEEGNE